MVAFYNPSDLSNFKGTSIVLDTNILSFLFKNKGNYELFVNIFRDFDFLIDPIIKIEFLRGAYADKIYEDKKAFLEYESFFQMAEHQEIFLKVKENTLFISRIHAHRGNKAVPLGDLLITARLMLYEQNCLFLTQDKADFQTTLFDRCAVISIENMKKHNQSILEHWSLLKFNKEKYDRCIKNLPKKLS